MTIVLPFAHPFLASVVCVALAIVIDDKIVAVESFPDNFLVALFINFFIQSLFFLNFVGGKPRLSRGAKSSQFRQSGTSGHCVSVWERVLTQKDGSLQFRTWDSKAKVLMVWVEYGVRRVEQVCGGEVATPRLVRDIPVSFSFSWPWHAGSSLHHVDDDGCFLA